MTTYIIARQQLNSGNAFNVGYVSGRFASKGTEPMTRDNRPIPDMDKYTVNIDSDKTQAFEDELKSNGVKFNKIA